MNPILIVDSHHAGIAHGDDFIRALTAFQKFGAQRAVRENNPRGTRVHLLCTFSRNPSLVYTIVISKQQDRNIDGLNTPTYRLNSAYQLEKFRSVAAAYLHLTTRRARNSSGISPIQGPFEIDWQINNPPYIP